MTELTTIYIGRSYDSADFRNFPRKSPEKVTKNLRNAKIGFEN